MHQQTPGGRLPTLSPLTISPESNRSLTTPPSKLLGPWHITHKFRRYYSNGGRGGRPSPSCPLGLYRGPIPAPHTPGAPSCTSDSVVGRVVWDPIWLLDHTFGGSGKECLTSLPQALIRQVTRAHPQHTLNTL